MYDVIVIGGGSGGYAAAIRASQLGGKTALVEKAEIGGTCVNRGCIPTKVWLRTVSLLKSVKNGALFGINAAVESLDLAATVARKTGVSGDIRMGMEGLLQNNGVDVIRGRAVFKNAREVDVDGAVLETKAIILAIGSCLDVPEIPGLEDAALTTDQVLEMTSIPSSVLIWGKAGPIETEMATLLSGLGTKVYLATGHRRILPEEDHDTSQRIARTFREQGVELLPRLDLESVGKSTNGYRCQLTGAKDRVVEVEKVLVSSRRPNTANMGLETIGVDMNADGSIRVNEKLATTVKGIYAIGDAIGGWMLSHASSAMAVTAAENAIGDTKSFPFHLIPRGIWTFPEVGAVGLSEEEAEKQGRDIEIGIFPLSINGLAMCRDEMSGAVKIISDARYGEILGVHIVGSHATDLIGEAVLAMQLEATTRELAASIRVHPTFSETVVDAARDNEHWALYLPKR